MSGKYFSEKTSGNVTGKTDVHDLVANPGNTIVNNTFVGFPSYVTTTNTWEQPTELGYKILNNGVYVDIANSIKAKYVDYNYSSTAQAISIPAWCNKLKIIAISGGGGGGSGGANSGATGENNTRNGTRGGSGGSGAGGQLAIMTSKLSNPKDNYNTLNITFNDGGAGGAYVDPNGADGKNGTDGAGVTIYATSNDYIRLPGGDSGFGGQGTANNNNVSEGGSNNNPAVNVSYNGNFSNNLFDVKSSLGNAGGQGGNSYVGAAGTVANYTGNTNPPQINTNPDYTNVQNNIDGIDNNNQKPGYGQGGVGGWNSNHNNGFAGQNGGAPLVRVYFLK